MECIAAGKLEGRKLLAAASRPSEKDLIPQKITRLWRRFQTFGTDYQTGVLVASV